MKINIISAFPDIFQFLSVNSLIGTALRDGIWSLNIINIRDFAQDKHKSIDDTVYGGTPGMLFKPDVLSRAITKNALTQTKMIHMSPKGNQFSQHIAHKFSTLDELTIISSRYEGIDQRLIKKYAIEEISIGDYILTGGEIPALVIIDAVIRLIQNVIGNHMSTESESFENFLLEYDQFTKPLIFEDERVPSVLVSGNHAKIKEFQLLSSIENTRTKRQDLWFKFIKKSLTCIDN